MTSCRLRDQLDPPEDHLEPILVPLPGLENGLLAAYTAAWFDVYLNGDRNTSYVAAVAPTTLA